MTRDREIAFRWEVIAQGDEGPGVRSRHCFAYDCEALATVLVGGIIWERGRTLHSDTWELRGDTWIYSNRRWRRWHGRWFTRGPSARCGHSLTFDDPPQKIAS